MPQPHDPDQMQYFIQRLDGIRPDPQMHDDENGLSAVALR